MLLLLIFLSVFPLLLKTSNLISFFLTWPLLNYLVYTSGHFIFLKNLLQIGGSGYLLVATFWDKVFLLLFFLFFACFLLSIYLYVSPAPVICNMGQGHILSRQEFSLWWPKFEQVYSLSSFTAQASGRCFLQGALWVDFSFSPQVPASSAALAQTRSQKTRASPSGPHSGEPFCWLLCWPVLPVLHRIPLAPFPQFLAALKPAFQRFTCLLILSKSIFLSRWVGFLIGNLPILPTLQNCAARWENLSKNGRISNHRHAMDKTTFY